MYMQEHSFKRSKINDSEAYTTSSGATTNEDTINASRPIRQKAAKKIKERINLSKLKNSVNKLLT